MNRMTAQNAGRHKEAAGNGGHSVLKFPSAIGVTPRALRPCEWRGRMTSKRPNGIPNGAQSLSPRSS